QRPYTLWMMADYGPGAATGTLCYNDAVLPAEYRGNLFLADFGKRQVMRVRVEREGASYRAVSREDLFPDPPADFRPVGIAWGADARSMYICDWQHRDVKEDNVSVGRLWKLSFTGQTTADAKPSWYLAAALGKPFEASDEELFRALSHPDREVRMVAQRRIVERGARMIPLLRRELARTETPAASPWHALWALDAIDGGKTARADILKLAAQGEGGLRRQAIRQLGARQASGATRPLIRDLADADATVRFQAANALGRVAAPRAVPALLGALTERDFFTRYAIFHALNRIGRAHPASWGEIVKGVESENSRIREGTQFALRETYDEALVQEMSRLARDQRKSVSAREAAVRALVPLHHQEKAWRGEWWAYHPVNSPIPPKDVAWAGTETVLAVLRDSLRDADAAVRLAAVSGLGEARDSNSAAALRDLFPKETDHRVRGAALGALGVLRDQAAAPLVANELSRKDADLALLADAIEAGAKIGGEAIVQALINLLDRQGLGNDTLGQVLRALGELKVAEASERAAGFVIGADDKLRDAATEALVSIGGESARRAVAPLLTNQPARARRNATRVAGRLKSKALVPALLTAYQDADTRAEAVEALARVPDERALDAYLEGLAGKSAEVRESCRKAIEAIQDKALPLIEARADQLAPELIGELRRLYAHNAIAQKGRLYSIGAKTLEPGDYEAFALNHDGDATRGRRLFFDERGVGCVKCHAVEGAGGRIGPDLSGAGAQFGRATLIESVLYPSKVVREGYNQVYVERRADDFLAGIFKGESADELLLLEASGELRRIPKAEIKSRRTSNTSLMPEGLQATLTTQEFADLIAFLQSLQHATGQGK
ncbi:MAG TPA: HEAT repeat domain-containing protein, partial [Verrucomicrobiae bacterium]|nr:HEAT repeat domain-containing protein [Verrucomicrobiae bacterium]